MSHGPEHHLEEAEHARHAMHDPFDRRVAMTIAIVAAVLACVTMLGHREHNETLRLQTQADIHHTKANDQWNFYQAKNIRNHEYQANIKLLEVLPQDPSTAAARERVKREWQEQVDKYKEQLPEMEQEARNQTREAEELQRHSDEAHHRGDRFDLGELGVELALVLCSVAVLTKRAAFWHSGIAIGVVGLGVALSGLLMH